MFLQEILKITFESFQIRSYIFRMEYNVAFLKKILSIAAIVSCLLETWLVIFSK